MTKVWAQLFLFLLSISFAFNESLSSYAGSASSIINPSKVKQVSWKPRFLILPIYYFLFLLFLNILRFILYFDFRMQFYLSDSFGWTQSVRLWRVPYGVGMRSLDLSRKFHSLILSIWSSKWLNFLLRIEILMIYVCGLFWE